MPLEVSQHPNDTSKVASSSDKTIPQISRQSLETFISFNGSNVISPPSNKAPQNSSTEPSKQPTPPPKAPENTISPPKYSPPPPQNSFPPPSPKNAPLLPPPPPPPPPPDVPKLSPPPQPSVSPPPPISYNHLLPPIPFSPPPSRRQHSPRLPRLPPRLGPTPPLLLPTPPSGTSLVPPQNPSNYVLKNAHEHSNSDGYVIGTREATVLGVSFLLLGSIGMIVWCVLSRKRTYSRHSSYLMPTSLISSHGSSDSEFLKMQQSQSHALYDYPKSDTKGWGNSRYTYKELSEATNQFSKKNLLGEGGFGLVYKGHLPDGREIAVKQLKEGGGQGEREFRAEVETISHIHHKHLVSLIGYCISRSRRLLVYDYVPNNTLHFHLHENGDHVLDWDARFKIALGTARGIAYLHEDCHPRIIHRDIKSSNILVDNNFQAQVSDFGLARLFSDAYTHVTTRVMGTFGYMAPEYALSGKLTDKSDVFSFGVVLLELITGRKPVDSSQPSGEESLVEWARPLLRIALEREEFEALVDPRLENSYVDDEMFRVIEAAASCVRHLASKRPRMIQVVRAFDSMIVVSDLTNGMRVGESKMFDSMKESAELRLLQNMAFGGQNYSSSTYSHSTWRSED